MIGAVKELFRTTVNAHGVPAPPMLAVRDILFHDFDAQWAHENQKFDFSFSSIQEAGFRFSYNDFGEKDAFPAKLLECVRGLGAVYPPNLWRSVLEAASSVGRRHQTTFGIEWMPDATWPRLKLYFEELHHHYADETRLALAKAIGKAAGLVWDGSITSSVPPAAICVDFFPNGVRAMKSYAIVKTPKSLLPVVRHWGSGPLKGLLDFQRSLSVEKRAFHYLMERTDSAGKLLSIKWYKIYEVRQIEDFNPAHREIEGLWNRIHASLNLRGIFLNHSRKFGLNPYPVIASIDLKPGGGDWKVDLYYSVGLTQ